MATLFNGLKRFLYKHSNIVDLFLASLIICLCLIVLMPKVHDSFKISSRGEPTQIEAAKELLIEPIAQVQENNGTTTTGASKSIASLAKEKHKHTLPIGEVIICLGFFLFYCIGLGISEGKKDSLGQPSQWHGGHGRKLSTMCCPTTGCQASQPAGHSRELAGLRSRDEPAEASALLAGASIDESGEADSCVLFLNAHHVHHTHDSHSQPPRHHVNKLAGKGYGSTSRAQLMGASNQASVEAPPTADQVEEIRITRLGLEPSDPNYSGPLTWPRSVKVAALGITLALVLILFDFKVDGFMEMKKAFLAASTGALLYLALFLVMPRGPPGCHSCNDEEEVACLVE